MFEQWINGFLVYISDEKNLKRSSAEAYISDIRAFQEYLHSLRLNEPVEVNDTEVIRYILSLQRSKKNSSTIARHLSSIRCFFQYLRDEGVVKTDPTKNLKPPRKERRCPSVLTEGQMMNLMDMPSDKSEKGARDKAILGLMYGTGLRVSEIIGLKIKDVDVKGRSVNTKDRLVPVEQELLESLKRYIDEYRKDEEPGSHLFTNSRGTNLTRQGLWKIVKSYSRTTNPQSIRNSFAVHMLSNGEQPGRVGQLLGHSDPSSIHALIELVDSAQRDSGGRA